MDQYNTLNVTLGALFEKNSLKNWSIFDDMMTGTTIVKLRFTKAENTTTPPQSFRRKSDRQVTRDRDRAARHRTEMVTRARAAAATPEIPRHEDIFSLSDTSRTLECSPVDLNPAADCFSPEDLNGVQFLLKNLENMSIS